MEIPAGSDIEREAIARTLQTLMRSSLRVIHDDGSRGTVHILQSWRPMPDGFRATFTPGIIDAVGRDKSPRELLERLEQLAF